MLRGLLFAALWGGLTASSATRADSSDSVIYVARRGWHLDIGFARADLVPPLDAVAKQFAAPQFVFFGFGDRHYLLTKQHRAPVLLGALWPGRGLILTTAIMGSPSEAFGAKSIVALKVSAKQLQEAQEYVWGSFAERRPPLPQGIPGPYQGSLYFESTPTYSAAHTCNTWVAESLRAAAIPVRSKGVVFAGQLWRQILRLPNREKNVLPYRQGGFVPSWQTTVVLEP